MATFAQREKLIIPSDWLQTLEIRQGGNEHDTFVDPQKVGWRIKVTGPSLVLRTGRRRFPHVTEANYLESWSYANMVFGDEVEFLGVIPTDEGSRLVICQPEVEATDPDNPHPTKPQICAWLRSAGFEYDEGAWLREADGIYLSDEHEGNFITTPEGLRPIDVHLRRLTWATGPVIPWADNPAHPSRLG